MADGTDATAPQYAPTLAERLARVAADVAYVQKKGFNAHFKYKFVSEADVKEKVNAALRAHGLSVTQTHFLLLPGSTFTEAMVRVDLRVEAFGLPDSLALFSGLGSGSDKGDKAVMKAEAAAIKYAWTTAFQIATGDDPEADESTDTPVTDAAQKASDLANPPVTEETMLARINTAPNAAGLASLKLDITAFQARDKAAFDRLTAAFRARNKELTK